MRQPVSSRLRLVRSRTLEEFEYAQSMAGRPVKVTLINPDRILEGFDREGSQSFYSSAEEFLADVVAVEREIVRGLAEAGCRYIQMDGPSYTRYVDERSIAAMRAEGDDPMAALGRAIAADNAVIAGFPGVVFGLHLCRGNRQSQWHREGSYDAIAERILQGLHHQRILLEYDTERAGGFEPLRFLPKGKTAVLGLITTKTGRVETPDELKRRIEEAARAQGAAVEEQRRLRTFGMLGSQATLSMQKGEYARAIELWRQVIELDPRNAGHNLRLSDALVGARRLEEAVTTLRTAISLGGGPEAHRRLAEVLAALGRNDESARERQLYRDQRLQEMQARAR